MGYTLLAYSSGMLSGIQSLFSYLIIYILSGICVWSIFLMVKFKQNFSNKNNKDISDFFLFNKTNALISLVFSTVLLSLAGFPPFIGFYVKLNIFLSVIESSMYFVAIASILCSVISTFYYIRIIKILYFENGIVGNLFFSISYIFSIILSVCFFLFIFLFLDPDFIYLLTFNMSIF
jgi:NADH-quinone oxidoreductase subunit N